MSASLLDRNASGGAVARTGFEYQDAFVLQHLPQWLSQSAFSHVVSEAKGDIEVCYFCPSGGFRRRTYEAKDYALTENAFWGEVTDFKKMFDASPGEFVQFVLVCRDFKPVVEPLLNKLERLRGVGTSYPGDSPVVATTRAEIVTWVQKKGHSVELADFIIDRVGFVRHASESADASFGGMVEKFLPSIDLNSKRVALLRDRYKALVARSSFGPVQRADLERALTEALDADASAWQKTPTEIRFDDRLDGIEELGLAVSSFSGPDRVRKVTDDWTSLFSAVEKVANFILASRQRRVVGIDGKQRMSLACLMGFVFSATRGFVLEIRHNGQVYRTDDHSKSDAPFFSCTEEDGDPASNSGVACIGFPTPVGDDVNTSIGIQPGVLPRLTLVSTTAIAAMPALNSAVAETKSQLVRFRSERKLDRLNLFLKAPSFFAMALGHRLNGIGEIHLYDWVEGRYIETAVLR